MKTVIIILTAVSLTAQTPTHTTAEIESLLAKIATYEYGADPEPRTQFDELVSDSLASPELRAKLEARLLVFLRSNATAAGKEVAFRELALIGTNASVPVLAPMLARVETAEMARYALAAIPGPAADEALRKSLASAANERVQIGIINSLGRRRDTRSVSALAALVSSPNPEISGAALAALANIADRPALDALAAARRKAGPLASEAYLVCADHLAARGDKATAVKVYKQMMAPEEPRTIRVRALTGLAAADQNNALPALTAEIKSSDPEMQATAIQLLNGVSGPAVTKVLVEEFPRLGAFGQVHLLTAMSLRGDAAARPTVLSAVRSAAPEVRAAALAALSRLGDASSVMVLAEAAAGGQAPEQNAARRSLYTLRGAAIDSAIVAALGSAGGKVKVELIVAAGERGAASAADSLAQAARESDPDARRAALRALRNVGGSAQTPALLDLLLNANSASERRDATQTLATVLRRSQPAPIGTVISAYKATSAPDARLSLLEVLGQTSSVEALPLLRDGLRDSSPEIARAAILALGGWDNPGPLPDLLPLAKSASNPTLQVLALRSVLKLMLLDSQRPASESGRMLGEAMRLATQAAEKRTVLSLLPYFPSKESQAVAQAALRDETVAKEAKLALDQVNEALKLK